MTAEVLDLDRLRRSCAQCSLHVLCLPAGIGGRDLEQLDEIVRTRRPLGKGDTLFRSGQALGSLFVAREGAFKTVAIDAEGRPRGIVAQLSRAIVVGPIARLELIPTDDHKPADNASPESLIEAQIPAQQFKEMGFKEGETLVVTPRRARVFLDHAAGI